MTEVNSASLQLVTFTLSPQSESTDYRVVQSMIVVLIDDTLPRSRYCSTAHTLAPRHEGSFWLDRAVFANIVAICSMSLLVSLPPDVSARTRRYIEYRQC